MQLTTTAPTTSALPQHQPLKELSTWLKNFKQSIIKAIFIDASELQVYQVMSSDTLFWYAFDPSTGETVYADSEAELRIWLDTQ